MRTRADNAPGNSRQVARASKADSKAVPNSRHVTRASDGAPNSHPVTRASKADSKAATNRRYIPAAIRRAVHERDGGQCTFVSPEGERCACRAGLQFDHVKPLGRGGETTAANVRQLCAAHNQLEARRVYGEPFVRGKQERARARRGGAR